MLAGVALASGVLIASTASAAPVEGDSRFVLRMDDCGEAGRLSIVAGTDDGAHGCSWTGLPFDEVFYDVYGEVLDALDYSTEDGMPLVLDARRDVSGVISSVSIGPAGRVGEVVVDVVLSGTRAGANGRPQTVELGVGTFSAQAVITSKTTRVPFTLDVPDEQSGVTFSSLQLTANIRGKNVNASGQSLNGTSYLDVPALVEDAAATG